MLNIALKLFSMNVPLDLPHKSRALEIMDLPNYLGVNISGAKSLSLCNYGSDTPTPENAQFPWLKLDENGSPIGWYANVNGVWTPVPVGGIIGQGALAALAVYPTTPPALYYSVLGDALGAYQFNAAGGLGPYSWRFTSSIDLTYTVSGTNDQLMSITVKSTPIHFNSIQMIVSDSNGSVLQIPLAIDHGS